MVAGETLHSFNPWPFTIYFIIYLSTSLYFAFLTLNCSCLAQPTVRAEFSPTTQTSQNKDDIKNGQDTKRRTCSSDRVNLNLCRFKKIPSIEIWFTWIWKMWQVHFLSPQTGFSFKSTFIYTVHPYIHTHIYTGYCAATSYFVLKY